MATCVEIPKWAVFDKQSGHGRERMGRMREQSGPESGHGRERMGRMREQSGPESGCGRERMGRMREQCMAKKCEEIDRKS